MEKLNMNGIVMAIVSAVTCGAAFAATEVRWTGEGADTRMTTADNWSGIVDLTGGTSIAGFANAGKSATFTESPLFYGAVFDLASFAVKAANAQSVFRLASGGLTVSAKSCSIQNSVEICGDQTWNIGQEFAVSGALCSDPSASHTLRKTGAGALAITGNDGTFAGSILIEDGSLKIAGTNPLGSSDGAVIVNRNKSLVFTANGSVKKQVVLDAGGQSGGTTGITVWNGCSAAEISGKVTMRNGNWFSTSLQGYQKKMPKLTFSGGVESSGQSIFSLKGGAAGYAGYSTVVITNKPFVGEYAIKPNPTDPNQDGISYKFYFDAAGNKFGSFGDSSYHWKSGEVHTTADGAFDDADMRAYLDYDFTWDLHGTWQRVGFLESYASAGHRPPVVTNSSDTAATLYFNQTGQDWTNEIVFGGKLDVVMSGSKKLTITQPMSASGTLTVSGGTLAFEGDGSWLNATALTVSGEGRVAVACAHPFDKSIVLTVDSAESLRLASGVVLRVSKLVLGGKEHTGGSFAFGEGPVLVGTPGFMIIVR